MTFEFNGDFNYDESFAVEGSQGGVRYPWIQADKYQPSDLGTIVNLGLTADSMALVHSIEKIPVEISTAYFSDEEAKQAAALERELRDLAEEGDQGSSTVKRLEKELAYLAGKNTFLIPSKDVRWVVLARPRIFAVNKVTGIVGPLAAGLKERGEVTITRVLLGCVVSGEFILDEFGDIQIFFMKMKSTKTAFVGSTRDKDFGFDRNNKQRTIEQLNQALVEKMKGKSSQWLGHTASVRLAAIPEVFTSKDGLSSKGVRFGFAKGGASSLTQDMAKKAFKFVSSQEFKELALDPFNKSGIKVIEEPQLNGYSDDSDMAF